MVSGNSEHAGNQAFFLASEFRSATFPRDMRTQLDHPVSTYDLKPVDAIKPAKSG